MHSKSGYKTELRNPVVTTPKQNLINKNLPYLQHYQWQVPDDTHTTHNRNGKKKKGSTICGTAPWISGES